MGEDDILIAGPAIGRQVFHGLEATDEQFVPGVIVASLCRATGNNQPSAGQVAPDAFPSPEGDRVG